VGKSVKQALSDFKKTRQDTWHVDVKVSLISSILGLAPLNLC
jgi:proteasome activator subunit 4